MQRKMLRVIFLTFVSRTHEISKTDKHPKVDCANPLSPVDPIQCGTECYGSDWSQDNEHKVAGQPSTNVIVFTLQIGYNSPQLD